MYIHTYIYIYIIHIIYMKRVLLSYFYHMLLGHDQVLELDADVLRVHRRADGVAEDQQIDGWVIYRYSIRQHTSAYVSIQARRRRCRGSAGRRRGHLCGYASAHTSAYVSIRQHTSLHRMSR